MSSRDQKTVRFLLETIFPEVYIFDGADSLRFSTLIESLLSFGESCLHPHSMFETTRTLITK